jgi:hypothetical protein
MKSLIPAQPLSAAACKAVNARLAPMRAAAFASTQGSPGVAPAGSYQGSEIAKSFRHLALRASIVNPSGKGAELKEYFEGLAESVVDPDVLKERGEMILGARAGDPEKIQLRAASIKTMVSNIVLASSSWANFFNQVTLGDEDWPMYEVSVPQEILVETVGIGGVTDTVQAIMDKKQYPIPMEIYWTQWFEYALRDMYKGNRVKDLALAQIDMARDFVAKIESILAGFIINGATDSRLTAAFDTTNEDLKLRDYVAHSRINTANFPAGNLVTLSTNTTSTTFRKEVLDAALEYAEAWGGDLDGTGPLEIQSIRVASSDVGAWRAGITLTSESNSLTEQIMQGGAVLNYAGKRFTLEGDNTLDPNDGTAYVQFNKPIGEQYEKTSFADVLIDESPERVQMNKGRMSQGTALGWALPRPMRKNILGIVYRTAS